MIEARPQPLEAAAHPRLDRAERLPQMLREFRVRQALEEGQRDRLLLGRLERVEAALDRKGVRAGDQPIVRSCLKCAQIRVLSDRGTSIR